MAIEAPSSLPSGFLLSNGVKSTAYKVRTDLAINNDVHYASFDILLL